MNYALFKLEEDLKHQQHDLEIFNQRLESNPFNQIAIIGYVTTNSHIKDLEDAIQLIKSVGFVRTPLTPKEFNNV